MKYLLEHQEWKERSDIEAFLAFCQQQLGYKTSPDIEFSDDLQHAKEVGSMGHFDPSSGIIWVFKGRRVRADWYRTLAHELVHHAQRERGDDLDGTTGSETENEANAKAGEILRAWGKMEPAIFESGFGDKFRKLKRLSDLGLVEMDNTFSRIWYPRQVVTADDFRKKSTRFMIKDLLTDEDFEYLDSLREDGIVWYTDSTQGVPTEDPSLDGTLLRITGPKTAMVKAEAEIGRRLAEAFHRLSKKPWQEGFEAGGWMELIHHQGKEDTDFRGRNSKWGGGQNELYARWLNSITDPSEDHSADDLPES